MHDITANAPSTFADLARAVEDGHVLDLVAWEAAEITALRSTLDGPLRVAIRDVHRAGERLLRARQRDCPTIYYTQTLRACRAHLGDVLRGIPDDMILT